MSITRVVKMIIVFPRFVNDEDNQSLLEDLSKDELQLVMHSFQKDKFLGQMDSPSNSSWVFLS